MFRLWQFRYNPDSIAQAHMTIMYELNPPRLDYGGQNSSKHELFDIMLKRISKIVQIVDGIHITDSVLGTRRLDVLESCAALRKLSMNTKITMSLRTRDRTFEEISLAIEEAARIRVSGILLVRGDPPQYDNPQDSKLYPGKVLARLHDENRTCNIAMLLSLATTQEESKIQKKIASCPDGFITQVIASESEVQSIVTRMQNHKIDVMPCIMLPSEKNAKSAKSLNLDWSSYEKRPVEFVRNIEKITGSVLITSPNDRALAESVLTETSRTHQGDE